MNENVKGELITPQSVTNSNVNAIDINVLPSNLLLKANDMMVKFDGEPPSVSIVEYPPIRTGEVSYIFGTTGAGKSIFTMQLAMENCRNVSGNVLYLDAENKSHQLRARYPKGTQFPENLYLMDMKKFLLETEGELSKELILSIINEYNLEWLIIDNLGFVASDAVQDSKISLKLAKDLFAIVTETQTAITIIAHSLKRENSRPLDIRDLEGSSKLSNYADMMLAVGKTEKSEHYSRLLKARQTFDSNELRTFNIIEMPYCQIEVTSIVGIDELFDNIVASGRGAKPSIDYKSIAGTVFKSVTSLRFVELKNSIMENENTSETTAKYYISQMVKKNLIILDNGKYFLNGNEINLNDNNKDLF